ncbi:ABC transporter substrate-binding protein [Shouchella clausii]|uniref:ABC transporter substrate-binding protein n=1 Tax=Shouchella clausii TaxID=79880 RepID=UPI00270FF41C|nr:extracellular solute-binding protein [Shouchella clausii]MDO7266563.1 extracellular solute-binding protein [Shouchella clausii]MDO7286522.1 extracellular solute-binding protein [Shouchella clausii]
MKQLTFPLMMLASIVFVGGCSSSSGGEMESSGGEREIHYLSNRTANQGQPRIVMPIMEQFQQDNPDVSLDLETIEQSDLVQRIQLLTASNALPDMFVYESAQLDDLISGDYIVNIEEALGEAGLLDNVRPAALDLMRQLSDTGEMYAVPMELNIEGFWYNKEIFQSLGLEEPQTWDELMAISDVLLENEIQPFALAGQDRWPITRFINAYAVRYYGVDAMQRVADGDLSITDEGFIKAAKTVQEMSERGYFGQGVNAMDYDAATASFLTGQSAMYYMGSWALGEMNDENQNHIGGPENIGFFNVPVVEGGVGTLEDYMMNAGIVTVFSKAGFDEPTREWFTYLYTHYADRAMSEHGMVSGLATSIEPNDDDPLTKLVLDELEQAESSALWFEATFNARKQELAETNAQQLIEGSLTPEQFMSALDE